MMTPDEIMTLIKDYRYVSIPEHLYDEIGAAIKALIPDPNVLTLPTPPPGTVALVLVADDHERYVRDQYVWKSDGPEVGFVGALGALLDREREGVRAELAPPPAPRTAAEIWAERPHHVRRVVELAEPLLAEALDREAGLA
jgi:hypothetical protein